jgi:uncharacterized membrane protein
MWRLVRESVRFYRPVLLISWAFGISIFVLVVAIIALVGSVHDFNVMAKAGVQLPLAILIASMIAGFIVTGTERSENRVRLHLMLPLPIGQVAVARVLLPAALMLFGLMAAHVLFAVLLALEGSPALSPRHLSVDFIAAQLLFWLQLALVIREIIELRHRMSWQGALGPKALLVTAVALMVVVQLAPWDSVALRAAAAAALAVLLMTFTVALFLRRTQFTR